ncbi:MAG: fatty acid cis/trans isomerase, partial [Pseudobdellovibrionaceae bacterium]
MIRIIIGLMMGAVITSSCVWFQSRNDGERKIASEKNNTNVSLAATDQFNLQTEDYYLKKIQPIFNNRCIACHSCFNSPCQLNLTSFAGVDRGAIKDDVYDFRSIGEKTPTRLGIDVPQYYDWETVTQTWRQEKFEGTSGKKGFFPVVLHAPLTPSERLGNSILAQMIVLKNEYAYSHDLEELFDKPFAAEKSRMCVVRSSSPYFFNDELKKYQEKFPWAGMPYGFPQLSPQETADIFEWIKRGANPPKAETMHQLEQASKPQTIREWEAFFNGDDFSHRITARYIYEHLFLAHIYFDNMPGEFFRLIRASCEKNGTSCHELPTRRPTDDPKSSEYYFEGPSNPVVYKFQKVTSAIVHKAHSPFELNTKKLKKWKSMFIDKIENENKIFPAYGNKAGGNPFITFKDIPAKSRYQFLLDDSYYFVMSFIKGPVCRGSGALSVIDDHFWVFFLKPDSDVTLEHPDFFESLDAKLDTPVTDGNEVFSELFKQKRRDARMAKKRYLNKFMNSGYRLQDIWDGDGENPNAVLTVYRHEDSASVSRGAIGESPKTMWMLDYPIFEDIYYNLVGTYDVYSSLVQSVKSRLHMDASRFNSQDMFLSFLPKEFRKKTRKQWSKDKDITRVKKLQVCKILPPELCAFYTQSAVAMRDIVYGYAGLDKESQISINNAENPQEELAQKILNYLPEKVTKNTSEKINTNKTESEREALYQEIIKSSFTITDTESIFSILGGKKGPFASYLPELAYVQVKDEKSGTIQWYTMIHNRERYNVAFFEEIASETDRLWPERDSINFIKGFIGSYANAIFRVPLHRLPEFVKDISELKDAGPSLDGFYKKFLVSRHNPDFWKYYDNLNFYAKQEGITP